jgi:excisionase family DNA binding protein
MPGAPGGGAALAGPVAGGPAVSAGTHATAPMPEVLTPEQAAQVLGVPLADLIACIESGELKARRIGATHRIARSALEAFLRGE